MLGLSKKWVGIFAAVLFACAPPEAPNDDAELLASGDEGASTQEITDVTHTPVKNQSIGNCWLYADASWAESLVLAQTGQELNMSESYWTYWHWFEQIANSSNTTEITTGGSFGVGVELMVRYGVMLEGVFIPEEEQAALSVRQAQALGVINEALKTGALSTPASRRNRALVRTELDKAWQLSPEVSGQLTTVFGAAVSRTLDRTTGSVQAHGIYRISELPTGKYRDPATGATRTVTLKDSIGRSSGWNSDQRTGPFAWTNVAYPSSAAARRQLQIRVQRALHAKLPVITSWFVDFNARTPLAQFMAPPATPGPQGGHMVVLEDYEIDNVPGFGTLPAGVLETRPQALQAALSPTATMKFLRVKNSWGNSTLPSYPGYHDLYFDYLNGPIERCLQRAPEPADLVEDKRPCVRSTPITPQWGFVLPPGY